MLTRDDYHQAVRNTHHALMEEHEKNLVALAKIQEKTNKSEQRLFQAITDNGGTALPNADENGEQIWVCKQVDSYSYDHSRFTPLLEKFNATELARCYTPKETVMESVTYPAKWRTQQLKAVAKEHGDGAPEMVEAARVPTGRKLEFERIKHAA